MMNDTVRLRTLGSAWASLVRCTDNIESQAFNGLFVDLAREHDMRAPLHELVHRIAREMAANREKPGKYTADELLEIAERAIDN